MQSLLELPSSGVCSEQIARKGPSTVAQVSHWLAHDPRWKTSTTQESWMFFDGQKRRDPKHCDKKWHAQTISHNYKDKDKVQTNENYVPREEPNFQETFCHCSSLCVGFVRAVYFIFFQVSRSPFTSIKLFVHQLTKIVDKDDFDYIHGGSNLQDILSKGSQPEMYLPRE